MPFCEVGQSQEDRRSLVSGNGINIFYQTYGRGKTKVLLIIGLAGTHDSWGPQIVGLTGADAPNDGLPAMGDVPDEDGIEVCAFDNRGMGQSSIPTKKSEYTTIVMAKDALAVMNHLGWSKAHVFGHSMGAMIACKLAAMAPQRISSLALLNVTGGGFECFPKIDSKSISIAVRFLRAKTPEQRAAVDLDTHYTKEYLEEYVDGSTRRKVLYQEYVKAISSTGMQSNYGFEGQVNACWKHKLASKEIDIMRSAGFLVSVIHGRYDIIAQIYYARKLAEKLQPCCRMVELHGGHLVSHERPKEVNQALTDLINAAESNSNLDRWSNLLNAVGGQANELFTPCSKRNETASRFAVFDAVLWAIFCIFGIMTMLIKRMSRLFKSLTPVRVDNAQP